MATKRTYDDDGCCAAAHALDLIGERWALLIVRELLLGLKRFTGEWAEELELVIISVGRWGARSPWRARG